MKKIDIPLHLTRKQLPKTDSMFLSRAGNMRPYLFEAYENLYGDLSANSGGCAIMRDEEFGLRFLNQFGTRLMFGTDMVNTSMEFPLGKWLDEQYECGRLKRQVYEMICRKNAESLFGLQA